MGIPRQPPASMFAGYADVCLPLPNSDQKINFCFIPPTPVVLERLEARMRIKKRMRQADSDTVTGRLRETERV